MASVEARALRILGGRALLEAGGGSPHDAGKKARKAALARAAHGTAGRDPTLVRAKVVPFRRKVGAPHLEPGELGWTGLIRAGLPARSTQTLAGALGVSVTELADSLRLPSRTVHRRIAKGEALTPEESERNVRAARVLAKAQEALGDENGRGWILSPCRALGGEVPITLLDTADGFTAVMDELGRLEHGVLS